MLYLEFISWFLFLAFIIIVVELTILMNLVDFVLLEIS